LDPDPTASHEVHVISSDPVYSGMRLKVDLQAQRVRPGQQGLSEQMRAVPIDPCAVGPSTDFLARPSNEHADDEENSVWAQGGRISLDEPLRAAGQTRNRKEETNETMHKEDAFYSSWFDDLGAAFLADIFERRARIDEVLARMPEDIKGDRVAMHKAVMMDPDCFKHAHASLVADRDFVLDILQADGDSLQYLSNPLKDDRELVLEAVKDSPTALRHASDALRADRDLVLEAVRTSPRSFEFADRSLKSDKRFVLAVARANVSATRFVDGSLRADREFMLKVVKINGQALEFATDALRTDREVVLAAVKKTADALRFAKGGLDKDSDCLIAADE